MSFANRLRYNRKLIITLLVPLLLLPILFVEDDDFHDGKPSTKFECAFVILLMAVYWMSEAIPLAITSLLPIVLLPLLGVLDTAAVSEAYMKETNMMFIGSLIIALAMEYSNLHRRLALRVMSVIGGSPTRIVLSIMLTTMFLSMWMTNTATSAMMLPIVVAVLDQLSETERLQAKRVSRSSTYSHRRRDSFILNPGLRSGKDEVCVDQFETHYQPPEAIESPDDEEFEKRRLNQKKMYLFAVAYSANIGGTGVITGTGTNLVFQEHIRKVEVSQGGKYMDINFTTWMALNVPIMLVNIMVAYFYLTFMYFGLPNFLRFGRSRKSPEELRKEKRSESAVSRMLEEEYAALGPMSFHESAVAILFTLVVFLWFSREPGFMPGWADQIVGVEAGDSTAAMLVVFLLFLVPRDLNVLFGDLPSKNPGALLEWKHVQNNLPWGAVLLLGGGFALSDAAESSGLSAWIGEQMNVLQVLPSWLILLIVMVMTGLITEVTSNVATANILLPILISLSKTLSLHPLYLTLAATVTCSYAFMFPVASPPNAIVFSAGDLTIMDMVKTGAFLNVFCISIFFLLNITYGSALFGYANYVYANNTQSLLLNTF